MTLDYPGGLSIITRVLIRGEKRVNESSLDGKEQTEREGCMKMEGKTRIMLPQKSKNMWSHQRLEETKDSFLESSGMAWPC